MNKVRDFFLLADIEDAPASSNSLRMSPVSHLEAGETQGCSCH